MRGSSENPWEISSQEKKSLSLQRARSQLNSGLTWEGNPNMPTVEGTVTVILCPFHVDPI